LRPASETEADLFEHLPAAESIDRTLGGDRFLTRIQRLTGRSFKPGKRGPQHAERKDGRRKRSRLIKYTVTIIFSNVLTNTIAPVISATSSHFRRADWSA
jgi:hypothetical protein